MNELTDYKRGEIYKMTTPALPKVELTIVVFSNCSQGEFLEYQFKRYRKNGILQYDRIKI